MSQSQETEPRKPRTKRRLTLLVFLLLVSLLVFWGIQLSDMRIARDGEGWSYTANHLHQCALAMHNYESSKGRLPPATVKDAQGHPLYSWRVLILPMIGEDKLYKQFHLDEPWDSPHNLTLLDKMPKIYESPFSDRDAHGTTRFQVLVGTRTIFEHDGLGLDQIPNGTSHTILIVESDTPVPWTKPVDVKYDPNQPLPGFASHAKPLGFLGLEAPRKRGFVFCFADGSTQFIDDDTPESTIRRRMLRSVP